MTLSGDVDGSKQVDVFVVVRLAGSYGPGIHDLKYIQL